MAEFDLTRCISSLDALEALCRSLPDGYWPEVAQNVEVLRADLHAADEEIRQLVRALRSEVEPPIFMGEPIPSGVLPIPLPPTDHGCGRGARCRCIGWEIGVCPHIQDARQRAAVAGVAAGETKSAATPE